jgi:hypothetical protein
MKPAGVNLRLLGQSGASASDCVDTVFVATNFERLIEHAKRGDRNAAKQLLGLASAYLTSDTFGPLPPALRRYLGIALAKISLGKSADITLGLKNPRGGRPSQEHCTMLRIGHLIYKAMRAGRDKAALDAVTAALRVHIESGRAGGAGRAGATLEEASAALRAHIKAGIKTNGTFYGYTKAPSSKRLEAIYNEVLPELKSTYDEVSLELESTSKT